ncbi:uncharacterized protein Z518_04657 [Rhinocladiella mackenziei CBS 650.93]|uniref:Uncharacterized protein n=1 Tax=Rhinocladiella mackenziei CBS 650.93 TaxID=1442369 RepID=A0A0D2IU38_9EURO|nr:uncharacterized protein Z518_04657 [Rhinocladiella mackenziei CBS 650.93]KIX06681.1 hypothetical protein Z518_04657 [Rhinocladiella mackenziei CBS 650.93]
MSFLVSLLCCSKDSPGKLEAETRHARLVAVSHGNDHYNGSLPRPQEYPDNPPEYKDIARHPLISIDEKCPIDFELVVEDEDDAPLPISPNSSVVSIPSTRLTDLTSMQTGETAVTLARGSLDRGSTHASRPPSYHSNPRRSPSPVSFVGLNSESERDGVWQHPVMSNNWLEVLRQDAIRRAATQDRNRERAPGPYGAARRVGSG